MKNAIKNMFWKPEGQENLKTSLSAKETFSLYFDKLLIGILRYEEGIWYFEYSEEFKNNDRIKSIIDFPDKSKKYQSENLWPFFATRIPTINQPYHYKKIRKANANENDEVALLKIFGQFTITNPYHLIAT